MENAFEENALLDDEVGAVFCAGVDPKGEEKADWCCGWDWEKAEFVGRVLNAEDDVEVPNAAEAVGRVLPNAAGAVGGVVPNADGLIVVAADDGVDDAANGLELGLAVLLPKLEPNAVVVPPPNVVGLAVAVWPKPD